MRVGDRVVDLQTEHRGTIVGIDPPALGEPDCKLLVARDDLPSYFAPVPYDPFEVETCNPRR